MATGETAVAVEDSMRPAGDNALHGNQFGRKSELRLVARATDGVTAVPERYFTMPFKVMRPFPLDARELLVSRDDRQGLAAPAQVMVMSVSAGIMAGDEQLIDVDVERGAALQVTTQAFEKIHRMDDGGHATRVTRLAVADGAYLDYRPQPQIPFADSSFSARTEVELAGPKARLAYEEILTCGRVARGERFGYRLYCNHVAIRVAGVPVYLDNTVYDPAQMGMEGTGLYEGFSHLANLVLVNMDVDEAHFLAARDYLREQTGIIGAAAGSPVGAAADEEAVAGGITRLASGDCAVRLLGHRAQRLQDVLACVREIIRG